jgi:hypothetical protein
LSEQRLAVAGAAVAIALYYEDSANFTGFRTFSATGGYGSQAGQRGRLRLSGAMERSNI